MIHSIRFATVETLKWGVSLLGPPIMISLVMQKITLLQRLGSKLPLATKGFIGYCSFTLLRKLTGCSWKTAAVASSVLPLFMKIHRPQQNISNANNPDSSGNDRHPVNSSPPRRPRPPPKESPLIWLQSDKQIIKYDLICLVPVYTEDQDNTYKRFRELTPQHKNLFWKGFMNKDFRESIPYSIPGYEGDTLFVRKEGDNWHLERRKGNQASPKICLGSWKEPSYSREAQAYQELVMTKIHYLDRLSLWPSEMISIPLKCCQWLKSNPNTRLQMFNNLLVPHNLSLSFQYRLVNDLPMCTITRHNQAKEIDHLDIQFPQQPDTPTYTIFHTKDGKQTAHYTFSYRANSWSISHNDTSRPLKMVYESLHKEQDWNRDEIIMIFELLQMSYEFLCSPYTVVFHENDPIAYRTDGTLISYEELGKIATYRNQSKEGSVLRLDNLNRVIWKDNYIKEYSISS